MALAFRHLVLLSWRCLTDFFNKGWKTNMQTALQPQSHRSLSIQSTNFPSYKSPVSVSESRMGAQEPPGLESRQWTHLPVCFLLCICKWDSLKYLLLQPGYAHINGRFSLVSDADRTRVGATPDTRRTSCRQNIRGTEALCYM